MSLLNSVLGSIGTGNRAPLPKPPERAATNTPPSTKPKLESHKSANDLLGTKHTTHSAHTSNSQVTALKRKLDGDTNVRNVLDKFPKPSPLPDRPKSAGPVPSSSSAKHASGFRPPAIGQQSAQPKKEPPKGSYLALLEQAKAVQAEKAAKGQQVGVIKHVASNKERLSKVGRRRREEEFRAQSKGKTSRVAQNGAIKKPGLPVNGKPKGTDVVGYKGTARPPNGTATSSKDKPGQPKERGEPMYKGTAGLKKPPPSKKAGGRIAHGDRYLDTDEEEEDDFIVDDDDDEGYGGPVSRYRYAEDDEDSDMEAGYSDVELEEREATKQAIRDDAREKALEERLKREKEAKKRALQRGR